MFTNSTVLVTGGTGSFSQLFIQHLLLTYPNINKIIIYSRDENRQYNMSKHPFFSNYLDKLKFVIGDIRDKEQLIKSTKCVDYIIHTAALKHIDICEYNPEEAIKTNIVGSQNVIDAAIINNIKKVIALSTDKACLPTSIYGATKLCSDKLFIAANNYKTNTLFSVVRYGNVFGSDGSVIPLWKKLTEDGNSYLPITDKDMTRFWLQPKEAIEMVIYAFKNMLGGEIFIKKIPSVKIVDIAKTINPNCKFTEIGIRAGEKIHEQMISKEDARYTLELKDYYLIYPNTEYWNKLVDRKDYILPLMDSKKVDIDFCYNSDTNTDWLSIEDLKNII